MVMTVGAVTVCTAVGGNIQNPGDVDAKSTFIKRQKIKKKEKERYPPSPTLTPLPFAGDKDAPVDVA